MRRGKVGGRGGQTRSPELQPSRLRVWSKQTVVYPPPPPAPRFKDNLASDDDNPPPPAAPGFNFTRVVLVDNACDRTCVLIAVCSSIGGLCCCGGGAGPKSVRWVGGCTGARVLDGWRWDGRRTVRIGAR